MGARVKPTDRALRPGGAVMGIKVRSGDQVKVISGKDNANRAARDSLVEGHR